MPNAIPTGGSTISVVVDGVTLGNPIYNMYRADIAELFPGYVNSSGAAAYFDFDTTAYANGVHTIAWHATDNAGNTDGIGSRYFSIQNSGISSMSSSGLRGQGSGVSGKHTLSKLPLDDLSPVEIIKGLNRKMEPLKIYPDENGIITVEIQELEHLEVRLFPVGAGVLAPLLSVPGLMCTGYQLVGNQLRPLPIGSTMDTKRGIFYWQLGPGFFGDYDFVFIRARAGKTISKKVKVKINTRL
jgi:hypothetical protein